MDYAIQLLLPVIGGLLLGSWLTRTYGVDPIWTVVLAVLGMIGGIGIMVKRFTYPHLYNKTGTHPEPGLTKRPKTAAPKPPAGKTSTYRASGTGQGVQGVSPEEWAEIKRKSLEAQDLEDDERDYDNDEPNDRLF